MLTDLSPETIAAFASDAGLGTLTESEIMSTHYGAWADWRSSQIALAADYMRRSINQTGHPGVELSATLMGDAARSFRATEMYGQDYSKLAAPLDLVVPMASMKADGRPAGWIRDVALLARYRIGDTPMMMGVEGYQEPGFWDYSGAEFEAALQGARYGSNGIAVYPYLNLFGHGEAGANMPAGSAATLTRIANEPVVVPGPGAQVTGDPAAQITAADPEWVEAAGLTETMAEMRATMAEMRATMEGMTEATMSHVQSLDELEPRDWAIVIVAIVGLGLVGAMMTARRRNRVVVKGSARDTQLMMADDGGRKRSWPQLSNYALGDGSYAACSALLRDLGPAGIEHYRVIFMLDLLQRSGGNLAPVLDDLAKMPEWRRLALRYVEECSMRGFIELHGRNVSITSSGALELSRAKEDGFSSDWWQSMETRIHETITVTCPKCDAKNPTHWFWPSIECYRCGTHI
ncbi:MAG: hypothetical protein AAGC55_27795, partial [Myxococcota bacterium]